MGYGLMVHVREKYPECSVREKPQVVSNPTSQNPDIFLTIVLTIYLRQSISKPLSLLPCTPHCLLHTNQMTIRANRPGKKNGHNWLPFKKESRCLYADMVSTWPQGTAGHDLCSVTPGSSFKTLFKKSMSTKNRKSSFRFLASNDMKY